MCSRRRGRRVRTYHPCRRPGIAVAGPSSFAVVVEPGSSLLRRKVRNSVENSWVRKLVRPPSVVVRPVVAVVVAVDQPGLASSVLAYHPAAVVLAYRFVVAYRSVAYHLVAYHLAGLPFVVAVDLPFVVAVRSAVVQVAVVPVVEVYRHLLVWLRLALLVLELVALVELVRLGCRLQFLAPWVVAWLALEVRVRVEPQVCWTDPPAAASDRRC